MKPWMNRYFCRSCEMYFTDMNPTECPICEGKDFVRINVCGGIK